MRGGVWCRQIESGGERAADDPGGRVGGGMARSRERRAAEMCAAGMIGQVGIMPDSKSAPQARVQTWQ